MQLRQAIKECHLQHVAQIGDVATQLLQKRVLVPRQRQLVVQARHSRDAVVQVALRAHQIVLRLLLGRLQQMHPLHLSCWLWLFTAALLEVCKACRL